MISIEKRRKITASLCTEVCFVVDRIAFIKPVGNGCINRQGKAFLTKNYPHDFGKTIIKIVVLFNMAILVYRKLVGPWNASHIKTVLLRCQVKLTAKRTERNIGIGNDGLVLKNNIYFFRFVADGFLCRTFYEGNDVGNSLCYGIHAAGEDDTGSREIGRA